MSNLPNKTRSSSPTLSYSQNINPSGFDKIEQANKSSLIEIFKFYNLNISAFNKKVCCPFSTRHTGGMDNIPSFVFYPETNSFWCFGCKTGNKPCNFVSAMENVSVIAAATIIFDKSFDLDNVDVVANYSRQVHLDFSNYIREIRNSYPESLLHIEEICKTFDYFFEKYPDLNEKTQILFLNKIKHKLEQKIIEG